MGALVDEDEALLLAMDAIADEQIALLHVEQGPLLGHLVAGHLHFGQPTSEQIEARMDAHQPGGRAGGDGQHLADQPRQPRASLTHALAPGRLAHIGQPDEHTPTAQLAQGAHTQDVGQDATPHVGGARLKAFKRLAWSCQP